MSKSSILDEVAVIIKPLNETITVEEKRNGVTRVKQIAPDDLIQIFATSTHEANYIETGFLPENCLSVRIRNEKKEVVIWHPSLFADITYYKTLYEHFPLPRMVFAFEIGRQGKTSSHRLAVIADEKPTPETKVYEYPFSNVYSHTGICIGAANSMPRHKNLRTLAALPNFILGLPNSDHLFTPAHNKLKLGYRELLDHLTDKPPEYYYEKVLVPRKATLQDFIDNKIH